MWDLEPNSAGHRVKAVTPWSVLHQHRATERDRQPFTQTFTPVVNLEWIVKVNWSLDCGRETHLHMRTTCKRHTKKKQGIKPATWWQQLFTSQLQSGRQRLRRSTLLLINCGHTDDVGRVQVNTCQYNNNRFHVWIKGKVPLHSLLCSTGFHGKLGAAVCNVFYFFFHCWRSGRVVDIIIDLFSRLWKFTSSAMRCVETRFFLKTVRGNVATAEKHAQTRSHMFLNARNWKQFVFCF